MIGIQRSDAGDIKWKLEPFASASGPEYELQVLIEQRPDLVPWEELGIASVPEILKREVTTIDGKAIDHLAVDSQGRVYIFECKIVTNHDLRSVIAQALEYAAQLEAIGTTQEFLTAVDKGWEDLDQLFGGGATSLRKGLERSIRMADYKIVIVTDFAASSIQARVNRRTIEYLRSVTEIYLVEIAKYGNEAGAYFYVPFVTGGGSQVDRKQRQLEIWKRNMIKALGSNPGLVAAIMKYVQWLQDQNPDGTLVTPYGSLSSSCLKGDHYLASIESLPEQLSYRIWVSKKCPLTDPLLVEHWESTIKEYEGKLGRLLSAKYYRLDPETDPEAIQSHHELQEALLELIRRSEEEPEIEDSDPD